MSEQPLTVALTFHGAYAEAVGLLVKENEKLKTALKEVLDIAEEHAIYFGSGIEDVQIETLKRCRKLLEAEETYPWPTDNEVAD